MSNRPIVTAVACIAFLALAPVASGQSDPARVALEAWVGQVNTGTAETLEEYINSSFTTSFIARVPLEPMLELHRQLMGVKPLAIASFDSDTGSELVATVSSTGGPSFRIQLSATGDPPLINGMLIEPEESR